MALPSKNHNNSIKNGICCKIYFYNLNFFCKFRIFLFLINNKDFYQIMYLRNFKLSKIITEHKTISFYLNIYPCLPILHDLIDVNSSLLLFLNGEKSPLKNYQQINEVKTLISIRSAISDYDDQQTS